MRGEYARIVASVRAQLFGVTLGLLGILKDARRAHLSP